MGDFLSLLAIITEICIANKLICFFDCQNSNMPHFLKSCEENRSTGMSQIIIGVKLFLIITLNI